MKIFLFFLITFISVAEEPKMVSVMFLDNCIVDHQENNDVGTVKQWFKQVKKSNECESDSLNQLHRDALYVKNSILALDFQAKNQECKEKFTNLLSNFNQYLSYIGLLQVSSENCQDDIANYWTHRVKKYTKVYQKPSIYAKQIHALKKETKLKFITENSTKDWIEFKFEDKGQSLTGWIEVVNTEKLNE